MTGMEITSLALILSSVVIIVLGIVKIHTYLYYRWSKDFQLVKNEHKGDDLAVIPGIRLVIDF